MEFLDAVRENTNANTGVVDVLAVARLTGLEINKILEKLAAAGYDLETQSNVQATISNKALLYNC